VIENYYAKVAYELGLPGLVLVATLFAWIIWSGWRVTRQAGDELRPCAAALTAFAACIALNSFKGWQLDLDPINVYFWVFAGILSGIPGLDDPRSRRSFAQSLVPEGATTGAPRTAGATAGGFGRRPALDRDGAWLHRRWSA
jgi:O-antigen ligase